MMIKPYDSADLDRMMELWRLASAAAHPFQGTAELDRDEALIRSEYIARTETWCAWLGSRLVGFISLADTRVVALFVDPSEHRKGIGSQLLAHANERHGPLSVEVFADNRMAVPFYRRHGFSYVRDEPIDMYPDQTQWLMAQPGAVIDDVRAGSRYKSTSSIRAVRPTRIQRRARAE